MTDDVLRIMDDAFSTALENALTGGVAGSKARLRALRAALAALEAAGCSIVQWRTDMENAPRDGTHMLAVVDGDVRRVAWGKTSHVPLYGFCLADQGAEDFDLCEPTAWATLPAPPGERG